MNDNVNGMQAPNADNLQDNAAQDATKAPQNEDKQLLAGKFKDRQSLEKSTLEIFQQIEGQPPTAEQKLLIKNLGDEALAEYYQDIEPDFTKMRQAGGSTGNPEQDELKEALKEMGFTTRDELEKERYEKEQLDLYLAQDPTAKDRLPMIKALAENPKFQDQSYAEIDAFIKQNAGIRPATQGGEPTKPQALGDNSNAGGEVDIMSMSDEDFQAKFGGGGSMLSKRNQ